MELVSIMEIHLSGKLGYVVFMLCEGGRHNNLTAALPFEPKLCVVARVHMVASWIRGDDVRGSNDKELHLLFDLDFVWFEKFGRTLVDSECVGPRFRNDTSRHSR
ncbi:MAG: hypothetical protein JRG94_00220 [Deltaproteobacteria bacterium]|nr:hypothetical protein [Deltaproteobacteria bacterium]MBW2723612.1 hypothetical protein [Deltaproteobacteria bacterium]